MSDGTEPIADDEILFRRIPQVWYDPAVDSCPTPQAFKPLKQDTTGLSVYRAKYADPARVVNPRNKPFFIASIRASDLRENGMEVVQRPIPPDGIGHAEIVTLTYDNRRSKEAREQMQMLAEKLCLGVQGPFP